MRTHQVRKSQERRSRIIAEQDVELRFDSACVQGLANIAKLPANADLNAFAAGIRKAAHIFARDARIPTANELHAEIKSLYWAAEGRRYDQAADLRDHLSPEACELLCNRGARILRADLGTFDLPHADALRDMSQREAACETIAMLCQFGGRYVEGRRRPTGKRSRTWRPLLYAPEPQRTFPKRYAEQSFVAMLSAAWLEATGRKSARSADNRKPGPFARLVAECLNIVGSGDANAIELINELNRLRQEMEERAAIRGEEHSY